MEIKRAKEVCEVRVPLTIILENQAEFDLLFAILNFSPIRNAIPYIQEQPWQKLYEELKKECTDDYMEYCNKLANILKVDA